MSAVTPALREPAARGNHRLWMGISAASGLAFFLVEIGDKTQVATVALAASYSSVAWVVAGTTLGMMIANVPAVLLGDRVLRRVPVRLVRLVAASMFAALGAAALVNIGNAL